MPRRSKYFHVLLAASAGDSGRVDPSCRFAISFEEAATHLRQLDRMYLEPDGSFVWVVEGDGHRYQLDGSLVDDGARLLHVELKGICDSLMLDDLLRAVVRWPEQAVVFHQLAKGVCLSEEAFRRTFIG